MVTSSAANAIVHSTANTRTASCHTVITVEFAVRPNTPSATYTMYPSHASVVANVSVPNVHNLVAMPGAKPGRRRDSLASSSYLTTTLPVSALSGEQFAASCATAISRCMCFLREACRAGTVSPHTMSSSNAPTCSTARRATECTMPPPTPFSDKSVMTALACHGVSSPAVMAVAQPCVVESCASRAKLVMSRSKFSARGSDFSALASPTRI